MAIVPPAFLVNEFATDFDDWFEGGGLFFDNAGTTALLVTFILIPLELVLLTPAYVLSLTSISRARKEGQANDAVGICGLIISAAATVLLAVVLIVTYTNG